MIRLLLLAFLSYALSSCASVPDYRPIVDTSNTQQGGVTIVFDEEKYANDYVECFRITNNVDYSDEKTIAALKGGATGAAVVGTGVATVLASGGVVMLPVVLPIYGAAMLIGGGSNVSATNEEEQKMRAIVWNSCLTERGYKVFSDPNYTN
tara:strand:+ start:816 stop:1268 length:453 start_codon:yes stop_codon:yes gene_type:complete